MSRSFTTTGLSKFIEANIQDIEKVRREVEEIQLGFQSRYVEWRGKHDANLSTLHENVLRQPQAYGAGLQSLIDQQIKVERSELEKR